MSEYIHSLTVEAAKEVASNLRLEDRRELEEGYGVDPMDYLVFYASNADCVYFEVPNGKTAGMAGVDSPGAIWMLCTTAIEDYPLTFAREAKRYVERRQEPILFNRVDERNIVHLKLLKFLGFKFFAKNLFGPNNLPFIEFAKWRSH